MQRWLDEMLNLDVLRTYNHGRVHLNSDLVATTKQSCQRDLMIEEIDFLTNANVYNISQLLYFFRTYNLDNAEIIQKYIEDHNSDMRKEQAIFEEMAKKDAEVRAKLNAARREAERSKGVQGNEKKQRALGKLAPRRQYTRFIEATIEEPYRIRNLVSRLLQGLNEGCLRFALMDLQRLLRESMVDETCSKTCWRLQEFGLLKWQWEGPLVIIESGGTLENCFKEHLSFMVKTLRPLFTVPYVQHLVENGHTVGGLAGS